MKSNEISKEEDTVEIRGAEDAHADVIVDDYKDLEIELMTGSREKTLWWMKDYD